MPSIERRAHRLLRLSPKGLAAFAAFLVAALLLAAPSNAQTRVEERSIADLRADLEAGRTNSERLVRAYLRRIEQIDRRGPRLNSVIALNPNALMDARALDVERRAGRVRGPLHGVPILIKDNIETRDPMPTTAGSLALADNVTGRDAPLVARLREAGAIILGKTNLSEWANIRSNFSTSGWSALGGRTRNPYALDRNPCGSSSGSGAAVAASLAAAAIGTETDGSIICPSNVNGIVGIKPTVGLVSRTHIIPISAAQDTAGPMARTVADAAALLTAIAGIDPADPATAEADARRADYAAALNADALRGARIGVARFLAGYHPEVDAAFNAALAALTEAGATLVEITEAPSDRDAMSEAEFAVLLTEFKHGLNAYLERTPPSVRARTLADIIAFNANEPREMALFGQDIFLLAEATKGIDDPAYLEARALAQRLARAEGIDSMFAAHALDAIVAPSGQPAWTSDTVLGDHFLGGASGYAAIAGYPHISVPMGAVRGLPVGLSIFGAAWSEAKLIGYAYAFEQRTRARRAPTYPTSIDP